MTWALRIILAVLLACIAWLAWNDTVTEYCTVEGENWAVCEPVTKTESITVTDLLAYTNQERVRVGAQPLTINGMLGESAQMKADDHTDKEYWQHNTPEGVEPWAFMTLRGYKHSNAGENLSCGHKSSEDIIKAWLSSPLHKEVMLNPDFDEVGFGVAQDFTSCGDYTTTVVVGHYGTQVSK